MNHNFTPSLINADKCAKCNFTEIDHTSRATCEACGNSGTCEILYGNMLLCMDCIDKEKALQKENNSPQKQAQRLLEQAKAIDTQIVVKQDLFNAETVSHIEAFKAIEADSSIENKMFAKATFLKERHAHFQTVIFGARETLENASIAQRAIQTTLNEIANKLRQDERDKLKILDNSYIVDKPKTIKTKAPSIAKKWNKADVREAAAEYKVPVDAVQMICVSRNMLPKDAAALLAKQLGMN